MNTCGPTCRASGRLATPRADRSWRTSACSRALFAPRICSAADNAAWITRSSRRSSIRYRKSSALTGVSIFKVPFAANLRARIEAYDQGFFKLWVRDNRVLAAQAIGHNVSEIIQEVANMIALKTPLNDVAEIIHAHPTYSEITRSSLEYALGKQVDFIG
ncbi:MAG: hypothetical protein E6J26_02990 [Chloroflexi bacterium]|nr:MAG: hypothetical protein E6J26_02990 [Chloroflexota bacterium]